MKLFGGVGSRLREHRGSVVGLLGGLCIALAAFFAGTWTGSSGILTLTSTSGHGPAMPHEAMGCCKDMAKAKSPDTTETPAPSHQMPGGDQMPGATHPPGDTHQMPGGEQMPGPTHPGS